MIFINFLKELFIASDRVSSPSFLKNALSVCLFLDTPHSPTLDLRFITLWKLLSLKTSFG